MSEETIFERIINGSIPADVVYENDDLIAFKDIQPVAPVHILVVPKRKIVNLMEAEEDDGALLGQLMVAARKVAQSQGLKSFRLVVNNGADVGQSVFHLHLHILGGREFEWPPG